MKTAYLLLLSGLLWLGCAEKANPTPADKTPVAPLEGVTWQLQTIAVDPIPIEVPDSVGLQLQFLDGQIKASGGCNQIGGTYELADNRLTVTQLQQTEMFCPVTSDWEAKFTQHLQFSQSYRVAGDRLEINCGDMGGLVFVQAGEGTEPTE